jgi:response regulator NasT
MKVLLVGSGYSGTARLEAALLSAGFEMLGPAPSTADLYRVMRKLQPDAIIAAADSPARDCLEGIALSDPNVPQPLLLPQAANDALSGSASGTFCFYVAPGLSRNALARLIETASAHFRYQHGLRELRPGRKDDDGAIARAKQSLMEREGLSEDEAYHRLRRTAMERGARIKDVAQTLLQEHGEMVGVGTEVAIPVTA